MVVDKGLSASFDAGDPVTHGVEAGLGGVDLDDVFELGFAALELALIVHAVGLALLEQERLGVLTGFNHVFDVGLARNARVHARFVDGNTGHKVVEKSSSHNLIINIFNFFMSGL